MVGLQKHSSVPPKVIQTCEQKGNGLNIQKVLIMEAVIIMTDAATKCSHTETHVGDNLEWLVTRIPLGSLLA